MITNDRIHELLLTTIKTAEQALNQNNYPIGSLITDTNGKILASDMNQLTTQDDITAHAEILCIRKLGNKIIKDKFQKNRGGTSRILDIACDHCGSHLTFYQKDGPGM